MKKIQLSFLSLTISFLSTLNVTATQGPEASCKEWLATQTAVQNRFGDTYDLSKVDAHEAFLGSDLIINLGIPHFLKSDLQNLASSRPDVMSTGKELADLLENKGRSIESITIDDFPRIAKENPNNGKEIIQETISFTINNFLWNNSLKITTEVTLEEVAAASCMRHRLIDYKKSLG